MFQPDGKRVWERRGSTLLEAAREAGLTLTSLCGGVGACGKCKLIIREGRSRLTPVTPRERNFFNAEELGAGYRLACEARVSDSATVTIEVPLESRKASYRLQTEGSETPVALNPSVAAVRFEVVPPGSGVTDSLDEAIEAALGQSKIRISAMDPHCREKMETDLQKVGWRGEALVYDRARLMAIVKDGTPLLGMAFDLGTTKLAAYLINLRSGKVLAKTSRLNPNVPYGEDVISRLSYIADHPGGFKRLVASLREASNEMIIDTCRQCGQDKLHIREIVLVGNTFMHHLALGLEPSSLGSYPFTPAIKEACRFEARSMGLIAGTGCIAYSLPNVSGFVGADCVADALAAGFDRQKGTSLMVDLGTNTELILLKDGRLSATSTASGPAFEGAHIKHGMRAVSGAVEHVTIDEELNVLYETIDGFSASGICGSGAIDIAAELVRHGIIGQSGRMLASRQNSTVMKGSGGREAVIVPSSESATGRAITFTQNDVRELQKAKGAIAAGATILIERARLTLGEVSELVVAGAFGTYVDLKNAMAIGMLPCFPLNKVRQIGNSAGTGGRMCLLSRNAKETAERIAKEMDYIELAGDARFQEAYIRSLRLAPLCP